MLARSCKLTFSRFVQLKIVDWQNVEKASDALSINGFEHYQANDYALEACYLPSNSRHTGKPQSGEGTKDFTKWWQDGDEPQYYLVSPKVFIPTCPVLPLQLFAGKAPEDTITTLLSSLQRLGSRSAARHLIWLLTQPPKLSAQPWMRTHVQLDNEKLGVLSNICVCLKQLERTIGVGYCCGQTTRRGRSGDLVGGTCPL